MSGYTTTDEVEQAPFQIKCLFSSPLYMTRNTENLDDFIKLVDEYIRDRINLKISNVGGDQFHVDLSKDSNRLSPIIKRLCESLYFLPKFKIDGMWININYKGSYNIEHCHPLSDFSAVFYLKTTERSGGIVFKNPHNFNRANYLRKLNPNQKDIIFQHSHYRIIPEIGDVLSFPSDLEHSVQVNEDDHERMSIAFNLIFI